MALEARCDLADFCNELNGGQDTEYRRTYPEGPRSRFLLEDARMVAMADMSPIIRGHCLIAPRRHELSIAAVANVDPAALEEFVATFLTGYQQAYADVAIFEHGSGPTVNPSTCVVHAHLHVVPLPRATLVGEMELDGLHLVPVGSWRQLGRVVGLDSSYYLAGDGERLGAAVSSLGLPKQYFRVVVGRILKYEAALCDWAVHIRKDLFMQTMSDLGEYFEVK